jgi:hypothetical protein
MALGETIGYAALLTQNNSGDYAPLQFTREVHVTLLRPRVSSAGFTC